MTYDFYDHVKIYVKAGDGGNGAIAFHREKYISHGGPSGGDGGNGGNVIVEIDKGVNTLLAYKNKRKFIARNGENGMSEKFHGANAEDLVLRVPEGTVIKDAETGKVIKDMSDCEPFVLASGGKGGWGNTHFATPTRQAPRFAKTGYKGEEREVLLELKMLADVGFVGLPNVGKSTLLSVISAARPKIANYHFTTLAPMLGVVSTGEGDGFVAADIPGLIEGASEGIGLGHEFLRHVDRCRLLVHVVDVAGTEGRDPIDDIKTINAELAKYSANLATRPQIIAANKSDVLPEDADLSEFEEFCEMMGYEIVYISAATRKNTALLCHKVSEKLKELPPLTIYEAEEIPAERKNFAELDPCDITASFENGVFYIEGEWLENFMRGINLDDRESLMYFERTLRTTGIIDKMRSLGIADGSEVDIYGLEFDFVD
ncbi:MAG: GTPase ObgE [Clostridia bacterium]|nr:GTPase ObgE [Clostridia bacterium]